MAMRAVYTGRANQGTLTAAAVNERLYIIYGSGQDLVVHAENGRFVRQVTDERITDPIARIAASRSGRLAVVSRNRVLVFDADPDPSDSDKANWVYNAFADLDIAAGDASPIVCCWLNDDRLVLASRCTLFMLARTNNGWGCLKSWTTGCSVDVIAAAPDGAVFATATAGCQMVKVWQWAEDCDYMRFHYVVHSGSIRDIFWHQGANTRKSGMQELVLYTVSQEGRLYMWHSSPSSDAARPSEGYSGVRFALAGVLEFTQSTISQSKTLIAAGIAYEPEASKVPSVISAGDSATSRRSSINSATDRKVAVATGDSDNSGDPQAAPTNSASTTTDNKWATTASHTGPEASISSSSSSNDAKPSDSSTQPTVAAEAPARMSVPVDRIYAVFSDGSLEMWEARHPHRQSSLSSARIVLRTSANSIQPLAFPFDCAVGASAQSLLWPSEPNAFTLAIADAVGHVFVLDTPQVSNESVLAAPLHLRGLWDGHKEPVFHISVDPYSQRIATHSVEGELLIWDAISAEHGALPISRKVVLESGQIRTIAWAPAEHEFIAATGERVFRLVYNPDTEQWAPCDFSLPQMQPYDRIFTYPADEADENQNAYYISTVAMATRTVQTWFVAGPNKRLEYVGESVLKQVRQFDRASRVMPVAQPFFSRDNIMATFDTSAGKLRIWGIRTSPKLVWFSAKEHCIPCLNVDMIRYNSIDKAAIVSTDDRGLQTVTIWVFSSASRRSHYLPAGTIYPKHVSDRVQEVRWHLTEYAQTYLGIQWDDRIDIYCQERNIDSGWILAYTIRASEFGPNQRIGSFSFTAAGEPTFSIGKQLFVNSQRLEEGKTISELAYEEHGELPLIHPFVLTELMSWGKLEAVKRLLSMLYDHVRDLSIDSSRSAALPLIPMHDLLSLDAPSGSNHPQVQTRTAKYAALFGSDQGDGMLTMDAESPNFEKFTQEKADFVSEKLTEIKLKGLSPIDQARLLSIVGTISASQIKDQPIDSMGIRYLVKLQLLELDNKRARSISDLPYRELNWALHSNSQAILLQICLQRHVSTGLTWETARQMGLFLWLSDISALQTEVEKMARNIFITEGRDPTKCAIFYLALKKQRLLHGLWRTAQTHPEHSKMLAFLAHDFTEIRWRTAAAKNAYVLLSRQRYLDAATFFLLSGKLADAARVCVVQLKDIQLAVTICRCYEGDAGPVLKDLLWKHVLPDALKRQDRWLASLAFGIVHRYDLVLQSLADDLSNLASQIGVDAEISSYSAMNVLDTELLILYRSMLNYSSSYRAPLVTQAELIAQTMTIFECLGAPVMSLVVLEWWRKELFEITKRSTASASIAPSAGSSARTNGNAPAADQLGAGIPDMSAFSGFAGFGVRSNAAPQKPAEVDPLASGLLSMDSFGSMFSSMSLGGNSTAPKPASSTVSLQKPELANSQHVQQPSSAAANSTSDSSSQSDEDDSLLAVDIEDTPVQYACRVTLALQIIEFIVRSKAIGGALESIDISQEKQTVAGTLRLPLSVFPA